MSGSPQDLARACSRWSWYGCPALGLISEGQGSCNAVYARVAASGGREWAVRGTAVDVCQDTWHKFALMHPVQPGPGDCLRVRRQSDGARVECSGSASRKEPVLLTLPMPIWANCSAREGGYSAVSVLRYTPCSFTPESNRWGEFNAPVFFFRGRFPNAFYST